MNPQHPIAAAPAPAPAATDPAGAAAAFARERRAQLAANALDRAFTRLSQRWLRASVRRRYVYQFDWLGRPIIQYPQDMVALQDLVWRTRPDLIVETGIAHGGSLLLSASLLALLDLCDAAAACATLDPRAPRRTVLGIDVDIRAHNRAAIEAHPLAARIALIEGSSTAPGVVAQVHALARGQRRVMVCLDALHTHDHVLAELQAYAPLVTPGNYCVVFDTFIEDLPARAFPGRPWGRGNNPKTAVRHWLAGHPEFEADSDMQQRLQLSAAPQGFLRRKPGPAHGLRATPERGMRDPCADR